MYWRRTTATLSASRRSIGAARRCAHQGRTKVQKHTRTHTGTHSTSLQGLLLFLSFLLPLDQAYGACLMLQYDANYGHQEGFATRLEGCEGAGRCLLPGSTGCSVGDPVCSQDWSHRSVRSVPVAEMQVASSSIRPPCVHPLARSSPPRFYLPVHFLFLLLLRRLLRLPLPLLS